MHNHGDYGGDDDGEGEDDGAEGLEKAYEKVLRRDELNDTYGTEDSFFASEVSIESAISDDSSTFQIFVCYLFACSVLV